MSVKNILKIQSTGELCVDEGADIHISSEGSQVTKHVRIINPVDNQLTEDTRDVATDDLVTHSVWDGSAYISP